MKHLSEMTEKQLMRLARRVMHLQQLRPQGFRSPRLDGRGCATLTERLTLKLGTIKSLKPELSKRSQDKRERKKRYLAALKEERRLRDAYRKLEGVSNFAPVAPKGFTA